MAYGELGRFGQYAVGAARVLAREIQRSGQEALLERDHRGDCLDRAGSPEQVAEYALGGAGGAVVAEHTGDRDALGRVVGPGGRAMQVHVADRIGRDAGCIERLAHREFCAQPVGMWRRHMVGIDRFAPSG